MKRNGIINSNVDEKTAYTEYELLQTVVSERFEFLNLVKLSPKTGRKHQLRRHMKHISHHILGDTKYGRGEHNKLIRKHYECNRLLLHAITLEFIHPYTDETILLKAKLDETFVSVFKSFSWDYS